MTSQVFVIPGIEKSVLILFEILEGMLYFFPARCDKEGNTRRTTGGHLMTKREESAKNEFNTEDAKLTGQREKLYPGSVCRAAVLLGKY